MGPCHDSRLKSVLNGCNLGRANLDLFKVNLIFKSDSFKNNKWVTSIRYECLKSIKQFLFFCLYSFIHVTFVIKYVCPYYFHCIVNLLF